MTTLSFTLHARFALQRNLAATVCSETTRWMQPWMDDTGAEDVLVLMDEREKRYSNIEVFGNEMNGKEF